MLRQQRSDLKDKIAKLKQEVGVLSIQWQAKYDEERRLGHCVENEFLKFINILKNKFNLEDDWFECLFVNRYCIDGHKAYNYYSNWRWNQNFYKAISSLIEAAKNSQDDNLQHAYVDCMQTLERMEKIKAESAIFRKESSELLNKYSHAKDEFAREESRYKNMEKNVEFEAGRLIAKLKYIINDLSFWRDFNFDTKLINACRNILSATNLANDKKIDKLQALAESELLTLLKIQANPGGFFAKEMDESFYFTKMLLESMVKMEFDSLDQCLMEINRNRLIKQAPVFSWIIPEI